MNDQNIVATIKARGQVSIGIFGALFFLVRGFLDFFSLMELETGEKNYVSVWKPVAALYEAIARYQSPNSVYRSFRYLAAAMVDLTGSRLSSIQ